MKNFDISYFVSKKCKKTLSSGEEIVQEALGNAESLVCRIKKIKITGTVFILAACLVIAFLLAKYDYYNSFFYAVYFEGREIGLVKDVEEVESIVEDFIENKCAEFETKVFAAAEVTFSELHYNFRGTDETERVNNIIKNTMPYYSIGYLVYVDDNPVIHMESRQDMNQLIDEVKQRYLPQRRDNSVISIETAEKISGKWVKTDPENIKSLGEAFVVFYPEPEGSRVYLASRGDNLKNIAEAHDIDIEDLKSFNPDFVEEELIDGQKINLLSLEPLITIISVEEEIEEEEIDFGTQYVFNNKMDAGEKKTITEGKKGIKEIKYHITKENGKVTEKEEIDQKVVKEPEDKVIEQGTNLPVIPSGEIKTFGTGQFSWPVPASYDNGGMITRGFSGGHAGVDIYAGTLTSTPILAADSGTVVFSGYNGGYGNTVVIFHGNYYTLYAHHSKNMANVGDSVNKGSVIAYMGNTGSTYGRTGIHLHFEIRNVAGAASWQQARPTNPMSFF